MSGPTPLHRAYGHQERRPPSSLTDADYGPLLDPDPAYFAEQRAEQAPPPAEWRLADAPLVSIAVLLYGIGHIVTIGARHLRALFSQRPPDRR